MTTPTEKDLEQGEYFANRIVKRDRHLRKWARRSDTDCYRVYDRDIPELPLSLDRYGDAAVLYLYERPYDKPEAEENTWLGLMADIASSSLAIKRDSIVLKTRRRLGLESQYERADTASEQAPDRHAAYRVVHENGLRFLVNLDDYIDTGLFMDHRPARALIRDMADGKRVLNLFSYTGSFSVYALAGGASDVVGVDLSNTYLSWAERNIALNEVQRGRYMGVRSDVMAFLELEASKQSTFDLIILDPPTFSNSKKMDGFLDIIRHWPALVSSCLGILAPGGTILFSTNARSLRMEQSLIPEAVIQDISSRTIPEDFRGHPHRSWLIKKA